MARQPFRLQLAKFILGNRAKDFIPSLDDPSGWYPGGNLLGNDYITKAEQLKANVGWCFTANNAIVEPTAAVKIKLYKRKKDGDREEIHEHEILELLDKPNAAHTGEQQRKLHFTYMNFVGEGYLYMRRGENEFVPRKGQLPYALDAFPAHEVQFKADKARFSASSVRYANNEYPITSFIRDLNPDPARPLFGQSIIRAAALTLDTEEQMKAWNRNVFLNGARPGMIFTTKPPAGTSNPWMPDDAWNRFKQQLKDEYAGTANVGKTMLIENGDAKPFMMNQQELEFLAGREFSRDEILAMWRVSPGVIGAVKDVNRSNLDAGFYIHAVINVVPRIRQFVKQLNVTMVTPYDPTLELDFENPVPEDVEAKLKAAEAGVDKWWTKDEVRDQFGEKELPDDLGKQIIVTGQGAVPLSQVVNPPEVQPADDTDDDDDVDPPADNPDKDDDKNKALAGVKKKT